MLQNKEKLQIDSEIRLSLDFFKHINSCFIFNDIYNNNFTIALDLNWHLWVLNCCENYWLRQSFDIKFILNVYYVKLHR